MSWDRVQENWKKVSSTTKDALGSLARSGYLHLWTLDLGA